MINYSAAPLNLANADSLHLLTPTEQVLCSQLRILPKPYLVVKETLVAEFARRKGNLKRRDARDLVKIDVNKTSRIWDYLEQTGLLVVRDGPVKSTCVRSFPLRQRLSLAEDEVLYSVQCRREESCSKMSNCMFVCYVYV